MRILRISRGSLERMRRHRVFLMREQPAIDVRPRWSGAGTERGRRAGTGARGVRGRAAGGYLDVGNVRRAFYRLLTAAGLRHVWFHDLRHTYATLLIQQGESVAYVRDQMGHASI